MIKIRIRKVGAFAEVRIIFDGSQLDLGLLNKKERSDLAGIFQEAMDELNGSHFDKAYTEKAA